MTIFTQLTRDAKVVADEMLHQPNVLYFVPTKVPTPTKVVEVDSLNIAVGIKVKHKAFGKDIYFRRI